MKTKVVEGKVTAITVTFESMTLSVSEYVFLNKKFGEFKLDYYIEGIISRLRSYENNTYWMDSPETVQMWTDACKIQARMIESMNSISQKGEWKIKHEKNGICDTYE